MVALLENAHTDTLQKIDRLQDILTNLRFEGKVRLGKNLKEAGRVLDFFDKELMPHLNLEEKILFPFVETHLPKLESVIHLLQAEHEDFRKNLEGFRFLLQEIPKKKYESIRGEMTERLREQGLYLIYLLRNHIQEETETVYKVANRELRPSEKSTLQKEIVSLNSQRR